MVILVPDALPGLASRSRADVSLLIGTAAMVLTVPNSALTPLGNAQAMAMTFKDGVATRAMVKTGYAGTLITQVTSGLKAGQQVVLADPSTPLADEHHQHPTSGRGWGGDRRTGRCRTRRCRTRRRRGCRRWRFRLPWVVTAPEILSLSVSRQCRSNPARDAAQPPARMGSRVRFLHSFGHAPPS